MGFTPVQTFLGGLLLHISSSSLLTDTGRVFGISSVVDGAIYGDRARWRWAILAGLVTGPAVIAATGLAAAVPDSGTWVYAAQPVSRLALAGALVGFGSKLGSGCTSGHFLCGMSRLSPRSVIATCTFMLTAVLTARFFPAPVNDTLPAYAPSYPSGNQLLALSSAVIVAILARDALAALLPKLMSSRTAPEQSDETTPLTSASSSTATATSTSTSSSSWLCSLPYLLSGLTFSLGLMVSGMVNPLKVLGFLRFPPPLDTFDPSLGMIVAGAVIPNGIHWFALRRAQEKSGKAAEPRFSWESWQVPSRTQIDWRLLVGAAVFGMGWGTAGVCPGPAIETGGSLLVAAFQGADVSRAATGWAAYAVNMLLGMGAVRVLDKVIA